MDFNGALLMLEHDAYSTWISYCYGNPYADWKMNRSFLSIHVPEQIRLDPTPLLVSLGHRRKLL